MLNQLKNRTKNYQDTEKELSRRKQKKLHIRSNSVIEFIYLVLAHLIGFFETCSSKTHVIVEFFRGMSISFLVVLTILYTP